MMNTKAFFETVRNIIFSGKLSQSQVDSLNAILKECSEANICDNRFVAYILATALHEVGYSLQPVREGFATTTQGAINHVTRMFNKGQISKNYALPEKNGKSYFGRGFVQLTWGFNYKNAGDKLKIDLYNNPDLALDKEIAAKILVRGSLEGWFTGRKLADYFNEKTTDWVNARRIINGTDKAARISALSIDFHTALNK